jgi:hypothetical protein
MGVRGEIFSTRVQFPNRTYFFNVKENRLGDLYLNIVESKNKEDSGFERQSVVVFADDLQDFLKGFDDSLKILEKSVREKKRPPRDKSSHDRPPRDKSARDKSPHDNSERETTSGEAPREKKRRVLRAAH